MGAVIGVSPICGNEVIEVQFDGDQVGSYWPRMLEPLEKTYRVVARNAGFIGVAIDSDGQWDHSGFCYRATVEEAADDIRAISRQTRVEIINQVSESLVLGAMSDSPARWY